MDLEDPEDFDHLATLLSGFANRTRLALLIGFHNGYTATEVTDFVGVSRRGAQKNIEQMINVDLVYRPAADNSPTYALTSLGEFFAELIDTKGESLLAALTILQQTEANVQQQVQESSLGDGLGQADEEKLVHTKKWQDADERVRTLLKFDEEMLVDQLAEGDAPQGFARLEELTDEELEALLEGDDVEE